MPLRCSLCVLMSLLVSVLLPGFLAAADAPDLPKTAVPKLAIVSKVADPPGKITCSWGTLKPVWETRSREKNGRTETYSVVRYIAASEFKTFSLDKSKFYDTLGNEMTRKAFEDRAKLGDTIVVADDGNLPDQAYLRVFKDNVLILVPDLEEVKGKMPSRSPRPPTAAPPSPVPVL